MGMVATVATEVIVATEDMATMDKKCYTRYRQYVDDNHQVSPLFKISVYKKWMGINYILQSFSISDIVINIIILFVKVPVVPNTVALLNLLSTIALLSRK